MKSPTSQVRSRETEHLCESPRSPKEQMIMDLSTDRPKRTELPENLAMLHNHDCLLAILEFLSWNDLNNFSIVSKGCHQVRNHASLDQTRSGTIYLGNGVSTAKDFLEKARSKQWSDAFHGDRTHLRLYNLTYLSSNIDPIDDTFLDTVSPLEHVKSLDCSMTPRFRECDHDQKTNDRIRKCCRSWFLAPFEDYVDKGFAQGVTLSVLVPNLRAIDMSYLPLTLLGVALLAKSNPKLEVIHWNRSLIWPISNQSEGHLESFRCLKEVHLDDARLIFCADLNEAGLWNSLLNNSRRLERVSLLGTRWYRKGQLAALPQNFLMEFVRNAPNLTWFRSDLSKANIRQLQKERPNVSFVSSY